jgi:two-component system cell cycle response regulator
MVDLLEAYGYAPLTARNGEAGFDATRDQRPDLVICDVHLPKLDGYGVVGQIKRDSTLRTIPVLAVTALAMVGDRDRMLGAGFDGYISKPIEPETFVQEIEAFLPARLRTTAPLAVTAGATEAESESRRHPGEHGMILIIDDTPSNVEFARGTLEPSGYAVITAASVREAIDLTRENLPDAILCDLHMVPQDGRDFLRITRSDARLARIPVAIISTTFEAEHEIQTCLDGGAALFIRRPIEPRALLAEVAALIAQKGEPS